MSTAEKGYAQTEELGAQFIVRELDLAISHCEAGMTSRSGARYRGARTMREERCELVSG